MARVNQSTYHAICIPDLDFEDSSLENIILGGVMYTTPVPDPDDLVLTLDPNQGATPPIYTSSLDLNYPTGIEISQSGYSGDAAQYRMMDGSVRIGAYPAHVCGDTYSLSTASTRLSPHAYVASDGAVRVLAERGATIVSYAPATTLKTYTESILYSDSVASSTYIHPSPNVVKVGDAYRLYAWVKNVDVMQMTYFVSSNGITFSSASPYRCVGIPTLSSDHHDTIVMYDPVSETYTMVYINGGVGHHYVSVDGQYWREASTIPGSPIYLRACVIDGYIILAAVSGANSSTYIQDVTLYRKSANNTLWSELPESQTVWAAYVSYTSLNYCDMTLCADPDKHRVYLYYRDGSGGNVYLKTSSTLGLTWQTPVLAYGEGSFTSTYTSGLRLTHSIVSEGSIWIAGAGYSYTSTTYDGGLWLRNFGNATTQKKLTGWNQSYIPLDLPTLTTWGWTSYGSGGTGTIRTTTATASAGSAYILEIANTGTTYGYSYTVPSDLTNSGFTFRILMKTYSGGGSTLEDSSIRIRGNGYEIGIRIGTTSLAVYDGTASTPYYTSPAYSSSAKIEIMVDVIDATKLCQVAYRAVYTALGPWTTIPSRTMTTVSGYTGPKISVGSGANVANAVMHVYGMDIGPIDGRAQVYDLSAAYTPMGFDLTPTPSGPYGVYGRGIYSAGQSWTTGYDYPTSGVQNALPSTTRTSPRMAWTPYPLTSSGTVFSGSSFYLSYQPSIIKHMGYAGMSVIGCENVKKITWYVYSGSAYTSFVTTDLAEKVTPTSNTLVVYGNTISPGLLDSGAVRWWTENEMVGCRLMVSGSSTVYTVVSNTSGYFSSSTNQKICRITLDSAPSSGTSKTVTLYHRDALSLRSEAYTYGVSFGYFEIEVLSTSLPVRVGKLLPLTTKYLPRIADPGEQHIMVSNDLVSQNPYGYMTARRMSAARRSMRIPYRQIMMRQSESQSSHIGIGPSTQAVIAGADENIDQLVATVRDIGQVRPIIMTTPITINSLPVTLLGPRQWIYGRIQKDATVTMGWGNRWGSNTGPSWGDMDISIEEEV